jgi:hypothetical protein
VSVINYNDHGGQSDMPYREETTWTLRVLSTVVAISRDRSSRSRGPVSEGSKLGLNGMRYSERYYENVC